MGAIRPIILKRHQKNFFSPISINRQIVFWKLWAEIIKYIDSVVKFLYLTNSVTVLEIVILAFMPTSNKRFIKFGRVPAAEYIDTLSNYQKYLVHNCSNPDSRSIYSYLIYRIAYVSAIILNLNKIIKQLKNGRFAAIKISKYSRGLGSKFIYLVLRFFYYFLIGCIPKIFYFKIYYLMRILANYRLRDNKIGNIEEYVYRSMNLQNHYLVFFLLLRDVYLDLIKKTNLNFINNLVTYAGILLMCCDFTVDEYFAVIDPSSKLPFENARRIATVKNLNLSQYEKIMTFQIYKKLPFMSGGIIKKTHSISFRFLVFLILMIYFLEHTYFIDVSKKNT